MEEVGLDVEDDGRLRLAVPLAALDMNMDDLAFRLRVREMLRARHAGASFCDDEWHNNPLEPPTLPSHVLTSIRNSNLVEAAHCASSEDHPDQRAEMTVRNDGNFWSSTGSPHDIGEEFILYKLKHPMSVVRAVVVQVYRATFQGGGPIYPAKQLLVDVGHSPSTMRTVGGPYTMACTDAEQTFMIPPSHQAAATGSYVGIRFRGKHQVQMFDEQYYLSMQHIRVLGTTSSTADVTAMRALTSVPNPPRAVLPPVCIPQALTATLDKIIGANHKTKTGKVEQSDEYVVKIELPGWAQKDFMHFVEQLASSGGTQAPSHQLLPSLGLQSRAPASGFDNSSAHLATDRKASSTWNPPMGSAPQGMHGSVPALMQRNTNGGSGGGGNGLNRDVLQALDASTALDAADTNADAQRPAYDVIASNMHRERRVSAAEACGSAQPLSEVGTKEDAHECVEMGSSSMQMDDVADLNAVHSSIPQACEATAAASQSSRGNEAWLPGAQFTSGMAELDAAATVPGILALGASASSAPAAQSPEYGTLPPITPLGDPRAWALGKGWVPPWPCMHAHEACDGPVHASVCDDGGLRCVVWERRGRRNVEHQCEAVEESEMLKSGAGHGGRCSFQVHDLQRPRSSSGADMQADKDASAAHVSRRKSLKTAPAALMWCRDTSSSAVGGVRLQGVRKRPPGGPGSDVTDAHKPKRPHRSDVSGTGPCTRGDIQRMLFGPVEAGWFQVPMG